MFFGCDSDVRGTNGTQSQSVTPSRSPSKKKKLTIDDFELLKVVGKGSYGKVLVVRKKDTGHVYAMKVLTKANIKKRKQVEHTKTERRVMEYAKHPL